MAQRRHKAGHPASKVYVRRDGRGIRAAERAGKGRAKLEDRTHVEASWNAAERNADSAVPARSQEWNRKSRDRAAPAREGESLRRRRQARSKGLEESTSGCENEASHLTGRNSERARDLSVKLQASPVPGWVGMPMG